MAKDPTATRDNKGNQDTAALSAPLAPKHQTRKSLAGAPTALFEHQMVHLRQMGGFFSGKFSREYDNKSALYENISMRYSNKSALYEIISMRYSNNSALYENNSAPEAPLLSERGRG